MTECDNASLDSPDLESTTFAINDGERVCCSNGQIPFMDRSCKQALIFCNRCPVAGELFV